MTTAPRSLPFDQLSQVILEEEFLRASVEIFEEKITFNKLLGLRATRCTPLVSEAMLEMRPELIGHYGHNRIHGGVISASLDTVGGLAVMNAIGARYAHEPVEQRLQHFSRLGTIDLRVDYLHPGIGTRFRMRAEVLRLGARLASTRMEFMSEEGKVLSLGTASYIVS
ncbi:thioesterase family protein [Brachymonas denitrificans]|uniref:Uncharacterized domain 1-containing protein n=1 Tax=Brachymonas denitrificans DSM 15123 TaxID=1121117 RepID=A0A1H8DLC6_9BURK|nr:thioesterase family protein [Brachymonas denitrificans]SEN07956.1 uncharacterized domain 1-containing protein [Brachymonas denitrificans DSM 15123]